VSILSGNHGISRRRGGFDRRSGSVGCEGSRKKNGAEETVPNLNNIEDLEAEDSRATSVEPCV
jgi:hypothetical protein